ncbi:MAG TPA: chromate resistance protein ChrB domain-containing protein [Chloroflexia bacterium]|nr:chromate resistance protein ChrB domain-containing protein [Chloroflexia bacterium]
MRWVTWEEVGIDRMACAWLILKYIDLQAAFEFVPVGAKPLPGGAEAFDIPGARLSHRRGHSTFHTLLREYRLKDPVLGRIARLIDEVDEAQEVNLEPGAYGVDLVCRGIRLTSPDDLTALEKSRMIFEALYAQLKEEQA